MARAQCSSNFVLAALIVRWRTETPRRQGRGIQSFKPSVERQIEVVPALLPVGNHVQACCELVVDGDDNCVRPQFLDICLTELVKVCRRELQPSRKRITPDYGGLQRTTLLSRARRSGFLDGVHLFCRVHSLTAQPPSTVTIWPVIGLESGRRRKQAVLATSSALSMPLVRGCL